MALPDIVNMPGDTSPINAAVLTRKALDILTSDLAGHGNVLSVMHRCALMELLLSSYRGCIESARHTLKSLPRQQAVHCVGPWNGYGMPPLSTRASC